ncbi:MAG: cobyric acid synthase CobQ, partial [Lachnospiraceae bacterium]|nr:cobyric acid synthase CobQ [Lachnospiraceae bacterium]
GLLPVVTEHKKNKVRCQVEGRLHELEGIFSTLSGLDYVGYEIHMGETAPAENSKGYVVVSGSNKNVYGTYVHGLFDKGGIAAAIVHALAKKKGIIIKDEVFEDYQSYKERQYDKLADTLREYLDMEEIYGILREACLE